MKNAVLQKAPSVHVINLGIILLFASPLSMANEREEALFGETSGFETGDFETGDSFEGSEAKEFTFESFDNQTQSSQSTLLDTLGETLNQQDNRLDIGGKLYFSTFILSGNEADVGESNFNNNATVNLYFDAALADDVRFFYQQKITHAIEGNDSLITLFLSQFNESSDVDQLWLKFAVDEKYYFTLGRQPTKFGAGFVWQPTDFLNADQFNPLDIFDQRLGVNLIKLQIPLSEIGLNFYAIAQLNEVDALEDIGALVRAEYLTRSGEYALSIHTKQKRASKLGFDFSKGVNVLDLTLSIALIHNDPTPFYQGDFSLENNLLLEALDFPDSLDRSDEWFRQISTGFLYSKSVFNGKTLLVNGEAFYNQAGYEESDLLTFNIVNSLIPIATLPTSIQNNGGENPPSAVFNPLYFSKHYAALGFTFMGLGHDKDQTLTALVINNINDQTGVLQLLYSAQPYRDLSLSISAGWFYGGEGTFRPNIDFTEVPLLEGLSISPPRFSAEIQLSIVF